MKLASIDLIRKAYSDSIRPEPELWVDEWSVKHAIIPRENASEYGRYNLDRTPFAREVLRALSPAHPAKRIVVIGASQLLKTQTALNWMMACIDAQPANILALMPSGTLATRLSNRIANTIKATPKIVNKVAKPRSRDARNTIDTKEFNGGTLYITTAGSARNLAEIPARYIYGDEIDRWELDVNNEGDPIKLAEARTSTYGKRAKLYYSSSPTLEGLSKIKDLHDRGNQAVYEVPCRHCGTFQLLQDENLRGELNGDEVLKAWFVCTDCKAHLYESDKPQMLAMGKWRETAKGDGETWSFHINAFYAPLGWISWKDLYAERHYAKLMQSKNDDYPMQTYINTRLALPFNAGASVTTAAQLYKRAEDYKLRTVVGGYILTSAVDVQGDRLEVQVSSWAEHGENWVVDYHVISGSPVEKSTWDALDEYLATPMQHISGKSMDIKCCLIDTGGNATQNVYDYVRDKKRKHILGVKGASKAGKPIISSRPSKVDVKINGKIDPKSCELWLIGTDTAKQYLWERWHLINGGGAMHLTKELPEAYFDGLTAEKRHTVYVKGKRMVKWLTPNGARNEPLDLTVYNLAGAYYLGLHKKTDYEWTAIKKEYEQSIKDLQEPKKDDKMSIDWTKII